MRISKLITKNYRNLKDGMFEFQNGINYIYGKNAQGKTNLLESIWMFTGARSFRKTKDCDIISFGQEFAKLNGELFFEKRNQKVNVNFSMGKRKIFLNGIPKKYPTSMIGNFRVVLFTPFHLSLVKDGPENRRKFLDAAICQLKPSYTKILATYNQNLKQRNALLRQISKSGHNDKSLEIWDSKLAKIGTKILESRLEYFSLLSPTATKIYKEISSEKETLNLKYISTVTKKIASEIDLKNIESEFLSRLSDSLNSDLKQGFTSVGPHKDDLEIIIGKKSLKLFGSQGQQRSAVLSLKLSESEILEQSLCDSPVILLDDVMSELDISRQKYVIKKLEGKQTFITGCDKELAKLFSSAYLFHIGNGETIENEM